MASILINHVSPMPNKLTGIGIYTWRIVEALCRHGRHDYILSTNWSASALPDSITTLPLRIVERDVPRNEAACLVRNSIDVPRLKREMNADLIFHPQPTAMLTGMGTSVVVLHDMYRITHPHLYSSAQLLQWKWGTSRGFRKAAHIVAVSQATADSLLDAYPDLKGRVTVVHEASPITPVTTQFERSPSAYGLIVANVTPNKNVGLVFQALDLLAKKGVKPKILLVGRDDSNGLPALFQQYPDIDLTHVGPVDDAELSRLYAGAAAYINTSLVEGFCLPILEAHGFELPVICSDIPVLREVAGEGALFFDPTSPSALAQAIETLFTDPSVHSDLTERARQNGLRFSWEKAARETEAVFDFLLSRRRVAA